MIHRARRPLIIVKDGVPLLKEDHLNKVANGKLKWDDLIDNGLIEYLDAEEEENSYIAMSLAELNDDHTHLEIDPATMLGICAGIIPFSDHNSSPRNTMEAGMTKQALDYTYPTMHYVPTLGHTCYTILRLLLLKHVLSIQLIMT